MSRRDSLDLEILARIPCQLQDFGCKILENSRSVDGSCRSNAVSLVNRLFKKTVDTTDGELQTGLG
jgi:hypothetical protein